MIKDVEILDANYSGLEAKFPQGLKLDTDSPMVLLVGPNNVGKTAFLRMLATSIDFERQFRKEGISHFWDYSGDGIEQSASEVVENLKKATEIENGLFYFNDATYQQAFSKLCQHRGISYSNHVQRIDNGDSKYRGYNMGFEVITQEGKDKILRIEDLLKEESDENIWGFVKPTLTQGGEIYFQHFDLPQDPITSHEQSAGLRRYIHFNNRDDYFWGELKPSPGRTLSMNLDVLFDRNIKRFFEEHKIKGWQRKGNPLEEVGKAAKAYMHGPQLDKVPTNSRLCVIMDEPTIFLDAVNKFRFQKKMRETIDHYPERIQFFIATNDYALIQGLKGSCSYVNMYEQPAISARTFDVQKYLSGP